MTADITIPPEALEAAAADLHDYWTCCEEIERVAYRAAARTAILAALSAWPDASDGMRHHIVNGKVTPTQCLMLPLRNTTNE